MSPFVHVESVQALESLRGELGRFAVTAGLALEMADSEARSTLEWIEERLHHWRSEQRRWRDAVAEASAALTHCLNSGYVDQEGRYYAPSCGQYEMALWEARKRLEAVEKRLEAAELQARFLKEAVGDYHLEVARLGDQLANGVPRAIAFLSRKVAVLGAFAALRAPVSAGAPNRPPRRSSTASPSRGRRVTGPGTSLARPPGGGVDVGAVAPIHDAEPPTEEATATAEPPGPDEPTR